MKHDDQKEHDKQNMGNCLGGEQITYIKTVFCCVNKVFFCAAAIAAAFCMFSRKTSGSAKLKALMNGSAGKQAAERS